MIQKPEDICKYGKLMFSILKTENLCSSIEIKFLDNRIHNRKKEGIKVKNNQCSILLTFLREILVF